MASGPREGATPDTTSPEIAAARSLLDRFRTMVAAKKTDDLTPWVPDAVGSELASFARGLGDDEAAVRAAIVEPWSSGQTTRLKLVKRRICTGVPTSTSRGQGWSNHGEGACRSAPKSRQSRNGTPYRR